MLWKLGQGRPRPAGYCAKRFLRSYGGSKHECSCVCPSENNWFLLLVDGPSTRASVYWHFENLILKVPEKTLQKVKLSFNRGTFGIHFWTCFGDTFLKKCTTNQNAPSPSYQAWKWAPSERIISDVSDVEALGDHSRTTMPRHLIASSRFLPCRESLV